VSTPHALTDERGIDPLREDVPDALRKAMRNRQRMWSLDPVAEGLRWLLS